MRVLRQQLARFRRPKPYRHPESWRDRVPASDRIHTGASAESKRGTLSNCRLTLSVVSDVGAGSTIACLRGRQPLSRLGKDSLVHRPPAHNEETLERGRHPERHRRLLHGLDNHFAHQRHQDRDAGHPGRLRAYVIGRAPSERQVPRISGFTLRQTSADPELGNSRRTDFAKLSTGVRPMCAHCGAELPSPNLPTTVWHFNNSGCPTHGCIGLLPIRGCNRL